MAEGKNIPGLTPDLASVEAARLVLEVRLGVVASLIPKAVTQSHRDPEFVHQLRVATRRADSALRVFRPCVPGRQYRAARQRLRTIRRAAGAARDWDVFLFALEERAKEAKAKELPGLDCLIGLALGQRREAQAALAAIEPAEAFAEFVRSLLGSLRPAESGDTETLAAVARVAVPHQLGRFEQAVAGDLEDYDQLHRVRIEGKRLRYAMELLGDCYPDEFAKGVVGRVEEMQEILGRANDSHVAGARLAALREQLKHRPATRDRVKPGVEALARSHQRRLRQERKRFEKWLQAWRDAAATLSAPSG